ncbi:MAG: hypothetical protein ABI402_01850 [Ferruginibacter sp.]
MFSFLSLKKNIESIVAAVVGFTIIFLFTRHSGVGIEPDGVAYITTVENFHSSGKLADFTKQAMVEFPLFYPLFLNSIYWLTGIKPLFFGAILNAWLFAVIIYLSGCIMEYFSFKSKWYKCAILSCIVLSPALLEVYSMLWSETIFILWLLLFMIAMRSYFQSYSRKALAAAAIIASIASVTRYAGVTIIGTGGILLLLDMKIPLRQKATNIILYAAISPVLLIINLIRNHSVGSSFTGLRERSITSLSANSHDAGVVLYDWLPFLHEHHNGTGVLVILLIAIPSIVLIKQFLKDHRLSSYENIAACFSIIYLLFIIVIASISRFEQLNSRFLSPLFIPLLWCCSKPIIYFSNKMKKKWMIVLGIIIFACFQYGQLAADYETWDGVKDAGIPGYAEDQWTLSETVLYIQKDSIPFKKDYTIYSNANDAVYFFTRREGKFLPHKELPDRINEFVNDHHCYVVWFDDGDNTDLVGKDFITNVKKMKLLKQFSDGAIYVCDE